MSQLFNRAAWIQIGTRRYEGLHLRFKVTKSLTGDANTAEIQVFNLSASSRAAIPKEDVPVILVAGYVGMTEVIFAGQARTVDHVRQGPDWTTHIKAGDGEAACEKYSVQSFGPGAKITDILAKLAGDLGVSVKDAIQQVRSGNITPAISSFAQGYAMQGRTVRELDRITKAAGVEWSIQDGALQLLEPGKVTDATAVVLSPSTGLVGSPDHGKPQKPDAPSYLKVRCLLNGSIRPGRGLKLESAAHSGFYRAERVTHAGELDGQNWHTEAEIVPMGSP